MLSAIALCLLGVVHAAAAAPVTTEQKGSPSSSNKTSLPILGPENSNLTSPLLIPNASIALNLVATQPLIDNATIFKIGADNDTDIHTDTLASTDSSTSLSLPFDFSRPSLLTYSLTPSSYVNFPRTKAGPLFLFGQFHAWISPRTSLASLSQSGLGLTTMLHMVQPLHPSLDVSHIFGLVCKDMLLGLFKQETISEDVWAVPEVEVRTQWRNMGVLGMLRTYAGGVGGAGGGGAAAGGGTSGSGGSSQGYFGTVPPAGNSTADDITNATLASRAATNGSSGTGTASSSASSASSSSGPPTLTANDRTILTDPTNPNLLIMLAYQPGTIPPTTALICTQLFFQERIFPRLASEPLWLGMDAGQTFDYRMPVQAGGGRGQDHGQHRIFVQVLETQGSVRDADGSNQELVEITWRDFGAVVLRVLTEWLAGTGQVRPYGAAGYMRDRRGRVMMR